jgi:hypothetical protein
VFQCREIGHKVLSCPNKGKNNKGSGHDDTVAEVALAMINVGDNCHIFDYSKGSE